MDKGLDEGMVKVIQLNHKNEGEIFCSGCTLIYDVNKCNKLDSDFDDYATGMIWHESHCLMEHISGFTRSH